MVRRFHLFFLVLFVLSSASVVPAQEEKATPQISEQLLPASTKMWFSVPNFKNLQDSFDSTQLGQLAQDEELQPFIESIRKQIQGWLNEKNVRLGLKIEDVQKVRTGEICIAGVLQGIEQAQGEALGRGSHGLVLIVNIEGSEKETEELLTKVGEDFRARGAKKEPMDDIQGVKVTKWKTERKRLRDSQFTYHAITKGWLVASDNVNTIREIIRRLANLENLKAEDTLASQPAFKSVMDNSSLGEVEAHCRWFIAPFGYIKLAQAIEAEEQPFARKKNDNADILRNEGFDAFKGVGGQIAFATEDQELLHRTFVYAPRNDSLNANQKRVFGLFDFENKSNSPLDPPSWIPSEAATYISLTWDIQKAFNNLGFVVDAFADEGTWEAALESIESDEDFGVNLQDLVSAFGKQITVVSAIEQPIEETSERIAFGLPVDEELAETTFNNVLKALGKGNAKKIKLAGLDVIEQDTTRVALQDDPLEGALNDPLEIDTGEDEPEEEEEREFRLFEKRYIALSQPDDANPTRYLIVANDKYFLRKLLTEKSAKKLQEMSDYSRVKESLGKLAAEDKISLRHFGRVDHAVRANYEMLRQGKMASSNTALARILNHVMTPEENFEEHIPRDQQVDGSKLPEDFDKHVAPYLGPMGWVIETDTDGWRLTGVMLKKKPMSEVVRKPEDDTHTR